MSCRAYALAAVLTLSGLTIRRKYSACAAAKAGKDIEPRIYNEMCGEPSVADGRAREEKPRRRERLLRAGGNMAAGEHAQYQEIPDTIQ